MLPAPDPPAMKTPSAPLSAIRLASPRTVVVTLAWDQLHLVYDSLPRTVPPAIVLIGFEAYRRRRATG